VSEPTPFVFDESEERKRFAPATLRNRDVIAEVLGAILPASGRVLEIASGTGEHIVHFGARFPALEWQPSDHDPLALASIDAWREEAGGNNVMPAMQLDASTKHWSVDHADAVLCINMVHIAPWQAAVGLMQGAGRLLPPGGVLYFYGPFREDGISLAESNEAFDISLKSRNPEWGLRLVGDVRDLAAQAGLMLEQRIEMPTNNLSLIFRKL
jgi:SAM-dependent methyltransferase